MDKYDYIEEIIIFIRGTTGTNYQMHIGTILRIYWNAKGKTYEMPAYLGGDQKNDGWVKEEAIFYQIYAPAIKKDSLKKNMQKKFNEDLEGLVHIVYENGKWNGEINKFIFLVNTFDSNLPQDSESFFDKTVKNIHDQRGVHFEYQVVNTEYIRDLLSDINDEETLKRISSALHVKNYINESAITEKTVMTVIDEISAKLHDKLLGDEEVKSYERISSLDKIKINSLEERQAEIENIISQLDVVEGAVNSINQDILYEDKFERIKNFIIYKYQELAKKYSGTKLYDCLLEEILEQANNRASFKTPLKFLVIYIFDKCDIFEKE